MRLVIAEDNLLTRTGLARILDELGHHVVGRSGRPTALLQAVDECDPDVAVVDNIRMPPTHTDEGLQAARF